LLHSQNSQRHTPFHQIEGNKGFSYDMLLAIGAGLWNMICSYAPIVTHFGFCSYGSDLGPLSLFLLFPHLLGALFTEVCQVFIIIEEKEKGQKLI